MDGVHALKAGFQQGKYREGELVVDDIDRRTRLVFMEVFAKFVEESGFHESGQ